MAVTLQPCCYCGADLTDALCVVTDLTVWCATCETWQPMDIALQRWWNGAISLPSEQAAMTQATREKEAQK